LTAEPLAQTVENKLGFRIEPEAFLYMVTAGAKTGFFYFQVIDDA